MTTKTVSLGWIHRILILFVVINILGDIGNVAFWYASPDSQGSLLGSYIGSVAGAGSALVAGTVVLLVVAVIYIAALFGLLKKLLWAPLLVIAISVANRALALVLYEISFAFVFWAVWTVIFVVLAYLDWRKMKKVVV